MSDELYRVAVVRPGATATPGTMQVLVRHLSGINGASLLDHDVDMDVRVDGMFDPLEPMQVRVKTFIIIIFLSLILLCFQFLFLVLTSFEQ